MEDWVIEFLSGATIATSSAGDTDLAALPFVRFVRFVVKMHSIALETVGDVMINMKKNQRRR